MDERLKRLIARREQAAKEREQALASRKAITDLAEEEAREDLSPEEDTEHRGLTDKVKELDKQLKSFDERIAEIADEEERSKQVTEGAKALQRARERVEVVSEARTYAKGSRTSYFRDLVKHSLNTDDTGEARERLMRHAAEVRTDKDYAEFRDLTRTDGAGGYAVPPLWLMGQYLELARAGRATANVVANFDLPGGTDSINIPKLATGTATAVQSADNGAVQETDLTDTVVTAGVKTVAGQQDLAIQLIEQSPINFDEIVFRDLIADYATKVDQQVISGSNASGQVKGLLNATGTIGVTYTDATPTVGELYSKLNDAIQQIHTGRFLPPSVIVMHPRRWAWFLAAVDSQQRPLVVPSGPGFNAVATFGSVASQQVVGNLLGLPVVTDPNVPTNLGAGTNEDRIFIMRAEDVYLWESGVRSRVLPDVGSGNLTVRLQVYGYLAFTAERYPASVAIVSGTGLVAPTF